MKIRSLLLLILLSQAATFGALAQRQDFSPRAERLKGHVYYLASDELRGRKAGSPDAQKAALYIVDQYRTIGLRPLMGDYLVPFETISDYAKTMGENLGGQVDAVMKSMGDGQSFRNVVAWIEGCDSALKHEYIVVGAHYDHLGVQNGKVYNGADDNASGTACVIEMARILMEHRSELRRSVVICAFDGEEMGLFGSRALAHTLADDNIRLMMSIDMVGWYRQSGRLTLEGTATLSEGKALAQALAETHGIQVRCKGLETSLLTATDTEPFAKLGFPTLAITTGLKSPYHKPEDDADLIDYEGLDRIASYLADLTIEAARREELAPSGRLAAKHGGKHRAFQMGVAAGIDRLSLHLPDARVTTDSRLGWQAGLTARFNMGQRLSLRTAALFEWQRTTLPHATDIPTVFGYDRVVFGQLTAPLGIYCNLMPTTSIANITLGLGGYYSHPLLSRPASMAPIEPATGLFWSLGMVTGRIDWTLDFRYQLNRLYLDPTALRARGSQVLFTMNYNLW